MRLLLIAPDEIDAAWAQLSKRVAGIAARSSGRYSEITIREYAKSGHWQLWFVRGDDDEICFVGATQFIDYPTGLRTIAWHFGSGEDRDAWKHFMNDVLAWAKANGATLAEGCFRRGWSRVFKDWTRSHEFLERVI